MEQSNSLVESNSLVANNSPVECKQVERPVENRQAVCTQAEQQVECKQVEQPAAYKRAPLVASKQVQQRTSRLELKSVFLWPEHSSLH